MSRTRVGTVAALLFGAALMALPAFAADPPAQKTPKQVTVTGEIVDLACYLDHGARGMKHQQCALTCLKNGEPMGLLTSEGKVYLPRTAFPSTMPRPTRLSRSRLRDPSRRRRASRV